MTATGARRGNLVYHWKHGWIPLDHYAALSKAKGSHKGAEKIMQKHGIAHEKGTGEHKQSAAEIARGYDMHGKAIPGHGSAPAMSAKRVQVEHSGDGTLVSFARDDIQAREAAKAAGFKWSSNLGSWFLPRNWSESTRRSKVSALQASLGHEHVHVSDGGHGKTTTAAEREAAKIEHAKSRAAHMDSKSAKLAGESTARYEAAHKIADNIPMGQPILMGHHSQGRHQRDIGRMSSHMQKSIDAHKESEAAKAAAERARATASGTTPLARQRRIDRNEAEIRAIDRKLMEHSIAVKVPAAAAKVGIKPMDPSHHAKLTASRAELADQVAHDKSQIAASGHKAVAASDVKVGDLVQHRGRTHLVAKVNKTTFSVPTGYSWEDKVPINQVSKHIPLSTQSDSALQAAYDKTDHPKIKAAFAAELKRRGLMS